MPESSVTVVPIILAATGVVPRTLHKRLKLLNSKDDIFNSIQMAAVIGTCHIVRKFISVQELL
jgi:hypothetical protein